jgi:hypothetical protein
MYNTALEIARTRTGFQEPVVTLFPTVLENLVDVTDISNYVQQMFSGNKSPLAQKALKSET